MKDLKAAQMNDGMGLTLEQSLKQQLQSESKEKKKSNSNSFKKGSELVQSRHKLFMLFKENPETDWVIIMGNQIIAKEKFKTKRKANRYIKKNTIDCAIMACIIATQNMKKAKKQK